jgi:hypothetical protein
MSFVQAMYKRGRLEREIAADKEDAPEKISNFR